MKGGSPDTFPLCAGRVVVGRNRLVPICGDPVASGRHLAGPLSQYPRNYVEFSRAKARENV
jgi:hypothetical protein